MTATVKIGKVTIGGGHPFCLIAGPCVIESESSVMRTAEALVRMTGRVRRPFIFKASYDKANRSSISSFRGPGLEEGLRLLDRVRRQMDVPILSDVHCVSQVAAAAEVLDVLQIPAFLCRQTDLVVAAASTGKAVNVKKGQFLAPEDVAHIISKIESTGNRSILITERGTTFGYHDLVSDFRSLPILRGLGYPVVYDATHSVQRPGGLGGSSGGDRRFVPFLARAAVAVGCDAVFAEVHEHPDEALSDGPNMLNLAQMESLLEQLCRIEEALAHG